MSLEPRKPRKETGVTRQKLRVNKQKAAQGGDSRLKGLDRGNAQIEMALRGCGRSSETRSQKQQKR